MSLLHLKIWRPGLRDQSRDNRLPAVVIATSLSIFIDGARRRLVAASASRAAAAAEYRWRELAPEASRLRLRHGRLALEEAGISGLDDSVRHRLSSGMAVAPNEASR